MTDTAIRSRLTQLLYRLMRDHGIPADQLLASIRQTHAGEARYSDTIRRDEALMLASLFTGSDEAPGYRAVAVDALTELRAAVPRVHHDSRAAVKERADVLQYRLGLVDARSVVGPLYAERANSVHAPFVEPAPDGHGCRGDDCADVRADSGELPCAQVFSQTEAPLGGLTAAQAEDTANAAFGTPIEPVGDDPVAVLGLADPGDVYERPWQALERMFGEMSLPYSLETRVTGRADHVDAFWSALADGFAAHLNHGATSEPTDLPMDGGPASYRQLLESALRSLSEAAGPDHNDPERIGARIERRGIALAAAERLRCLMLAVDALEGAALGGQVVLVLR